jgi:hypothetical protein
MLPITWLTAMVGARQTAVRKDSEPMVIVLLGEKPVGLFEHESTAVKSCYETCSKLTHIEDVVRNDVRYISFRHDDESVVTFTVHKIKLEQYVTHF